MSKVQTKRSVRQARKSATAVQPKSAKRNKSSANRSAESASHKAARGRVASRASKTKQLGSMPQAKRRASAATVVTRGDNQDRIQSERQQVELLSISNDGADTATALNDSVEQAPLPNQESASVVQAMDAPSPLESVENSHATLSAMMLSRSPVQTAALAGVTQADSEAHQLLTRRSAAIIRFATGLTQCRSPIDVWLQQIQFARDFFHPGGQRK